MRALVFGLAGVGVVLLVLIAFGWAEIKASASSGVSTIPGFRWVPWQVRGFVQETRLIEVPVRQPYPPGDVCVDGYLVHVDLRTRTSWPVRESGFGEAIPCLP